MCYLLSLKLNKLVKIDFDARERESLSCDGDNSGARALSIAISACNDRRVVQ